MAAAFSLGEAFLRAFRGLENAGNVVFRSKNAAEETLRAVKSDFQTMRHNGRYSQITHELLQSVLSRTVTRPAESARKGYRIVVDAGGDVPVALPTIARNMRRGEVSKVLDKLKVPKESTFRRPDFIRNLSRMLKNTYPDAALKSLTRRVRNVREVPNGMFEKTAYSTADDLRALIATDKAAARLADAMERTLKKGRPIVSKGLFFSVTLTGASSVFMYEALAESAKRAAGCWRVYRDKDTNKLLSCRVRYASCALKLDGDGGMPENKYCDRYPGVIKETSCADEWSKNTPCVHCDPAGTGTDRLERNDYVDSGDLYVCRAKPSLGEMMGQIVLDAPHVLSEVAGDVVKGAESVFSKIWNAIKDVVLWIAAGLSIFVVLLYLWNKRVATTRDADGEEREAIINKEW